MFINSARVLGVVGRLLAIGLVVVLACSLGIARASEEDTALLQAAGEGHQDKVKALLESGADASARDMSGSTALMLASEHGHAEVVKVLLRQGADVHAKSMRSEIDFETALTRAARAGHVETVRLLLAGGADVDPKFKYCLTLSWRLPRPATPMW